MAQELEMIFLRSWSIRSAKSIILQSVQVLLWADARQKDYSWEFANSLNNGPRHSRVSLDNKPQAGSRWLRGFSNNRKAP